MEPIRILVVDDSPVARIYLRQVLESDSALQVVGEARDGLEAQDMAARLLPDLITMDVFMPVLDGLEAIEQLMADMPTPILVVTAARGPTADHLTFQALSRGALDLVVKPDGGPTNDEQERRLIGMVKFLASVPVVRHVSGAFKAMSHSEEGHSSLMSLEVPAHPAKIRKDPEVVGIAASTGGPAAIGRILGNLPASFPVGIAVVQHIPPGFVEGMAGWLDRLCNLDVRVARDGEQLMAGRVLLAPDNAHLTFAARGVVTLEDPNEDEIYCPSGNRLLNSMARIYRGASMGVVLTGLGEDGAAGIRAIKNEGGATIAQDHESSIVFGMPGAAIATGCVDTICHIAGMAKLLTERTGSTLD